MRPSHIGPAGCRYPPIIVGCFEEGREAKDS